MKQKVLVAITGSQNGLEDEDSIQTLQPGSYGYIQNKHVIRYEELQEESLTGQPATAQCILKISADSVTLSKKGHTQTEMYFKQGESFDTIYETPLGSLHMGLYTTRLEITEKEDSLSLDLEYSLEMNYSHISDCNIHIQITSKN